MKVRVHSTIHKLFTERFSSSFSKDKHRQKYHIYDGGIVRLKVPHLWWWYCLKSGEQTVVYRMF